MTAHHLETLQCGHTQSRQKLFLCTGQPLPSGIHWDIFAHLSPMAFHRHIHSKHKSKRDTEGKEHKLLLYSNSSAVCCSNCHSSTSFCCWVFGVVFFLCGCWIYFIYHALFFPNIYCVIFILVQFLFYFFWPSSEKIQIFSRAGCTTSWYHWDCSQQRVSIPSIWYCSPNHFYVANKRGNSHVELKKRMSCACVISFFFFSIPKECYIHALALFKITISE